MPTLCLRCGNRYTKLKSHLNKKKPCQVKFIDIECEKMIDNYNDLYIKFQGMQNIREKTACPKCNKMISKSNIAKHKKTHNNTSIINNNQGDNSIFVNGNQTNINSPIMINVNANTNEFGNEDSIDVGVVYDIYMKNYKIFKNNDNADLDDNICKDFFKTFFEKLHFDKKENMNIYLSSDRSKYGHIFIDNKWRHYLKNEFENMVAENVLSKLKDSPNIIADIIKKTMEIQSNGHSYNDISTMLYDVDRYLIGNIDRSYQKKDQKDLGKLWNDCVKNTEKIMLDHKDEAKKNYELKNNTKNSIN